MDKYVYSGSKEDILNIFEALTRKSFSILATVFLSPVPRWSPTPASRIPNIGIPTRA